MITPLGSKTIEEYRERLTNLSLQKIDLGLSQDLQKLADQLDTQAEELDTLTKDGDKVLQRIRKNRQDDDADIVYYYQELRSGANDLNKLLDKANDLMKNAEKVSNDLGIREEDLPGYTSVENEASVADFVAGDALGVSKELEQLES